ncbi:MAG: hypothetical protein JWN62_4644 [Acidimicrobiales bacterium]|nr:hypothetical protein [Acidimicrobiales bacterium]
MHVVLVFDGGAVVTEISTTPPLHGVEQLIGKRATTGFRAEIDSSTDARPGELRYLLLDEIPVATLVAGYSVLHATSRGDVDLDALANLRPAGPLLHGPGMCAGYRVGGTVMTRLAIGKRAVVTGPDATSIIDPADVLGWHDMPPDLPSDCTRRWRRHDLWRDESGVLRIDAFFRDSHMAPDGTETIVHEYTVDAAIDPATMTVVACTATPRVLPFVECPEAAASARRIVGRTVIGLRPSVRADLTGASTCTHLNDMLRELEDAVTLAALLPL